MAIGDSLEKLIATRRAAQSDPSRADWLARREELFAPLARRLRVMIGSVDSRYIKSRLTRERAIIRIGNGEIDTGWEVLPNSACTIDPDAPMFKVLETRNFMSDARTMQTAYFADEDALVDYLERNITERIARYQRIV